MKERIARKKKILNYERQNWVLHVLSSPSSIFLSFIFYPLYRILCTTYSSLTIRPNPTDQGYHYAIVGIIQLFSTRLGWVELASCIFFLYFVSSQDDTKLFISFLFFSFLFFK